MKTVVSAPYSRLRVMADYSSCGLWAEDGSEAELARVPISETLRARLERWCAWFETNTDYLPDVGRPPFDYEGFAAEGLQIARALKAELPSVTVVFLDENKLHLTRGEQVERSAFEWEID